VFLVAFYMTGDAA
jgi:hypothetical protein